MIDPGGEYVSKETKARSTFLPFALPDLDGTELQEIKEALESGWVTTGPKVKQFEQEFAEAVGAKHAVAVNSCTAAMHLALEAIGLQRGDEVITTPYTFAATAEVIRYFDAKPVFVDVDPLTLNLNLNLIESAITVRTKAILPVHIAGYPAQMQGIHAIARKHGVPVIEDAAHADPGVYGSWRGQRSEVGGEFSEHPSTPAPKSGAFAQDDAVTNNHQLSTINRLRSTAACFSFYATKTITTGEGGMICTDDDAIADRCRIMALHGISRDAWKRYTAEGNWYYEITAPGYKYNMTDVAAAMGIAQLRKAERMLARRREIAARYNAAFSQNPNLQPPCLRPDEVHRDSGRQATSHPEHSWHLYMLRLNTEVGSQKSDVRLRIDRGQFIEEMKKRNIGTSVHFIPLHIHPYYRDTYGYKPEDFPVAYREYLREVSLPIYSKMSDQDVQDVIDAVLDIVEKFAS